MTVLRPFGAGGTASPRSAANDLKRPMNSALVACPTNVSLWGVMFAVTTRPHGPFISQPPENSRAAMRLPCASCGVWHSLHPPITARYRPYASPSFGVGAVTGPSSGFGTDLTRRLTGKSRRLAGTACATAGRDLR